MNKTLLACSKCKGKVPLNDLRADKDGKSWICTACYTLQHPKLRTLGKNNIRFEESRVINKIRTNEILNKKFKYQCKGCKFKFSRTLEYKGMCPYCSKSGTLDLINEDLEI